MRTGGLARRRAITIMGAFAGMPLLAGDRRAPAPAALYQWNGTSLGSPSRLLLYHPSRATAERVVALCTAEIERLERIFALYRDDSELACLNRDGRITAPSHDLLLVLSECGRLSGLSGGAFDVTVQPLWDVYATHFFGTQAPRPEGPDPRAVAAALGAGELEGRRVQRPAGRAGARRHGPHAQRHCPRLRDRPDYRHPARQRLRPGAFRFWTKRDRRARTAS